MTKRKRQGEKAPGYYHYPNDILNDSAVQSCSLAAQGLWRNMLDVMHSQTPRGVLPGDLTQYARMRGCPAPAVASYVEALRPLVDELERNRVFSRGAELHPILPENSIVNRRMFREWIEQRDRSQAARKAAEIRWRGRQKSDANGCESHAEGYAKSVCEKHAKTNADQQCADDAGRPGLTSARGKSSGPTPIRETCNTLMRSGCLSKPSLSKPSLTDPNQRSPIQCDKSSPHRSFEALLAHLAQAANDPAFAHGRHAARIKRIYHHPHGPAALNELIDALEKDTHPRAAAARGHTVIKHPARWAASRLTHLARELDVKT